MSLTAAQMTRLSALLDEALALPTAGRAGWLASLSPADAPLLNTLRAALLNDADDSSLNELPRMAAPPASTSTSATHIAGERIGAYELLRVLGTGGMGDVWLARRADGAFERQVALKIPRMDHVPEEMAARFARECRIFAALEFPGIARLYDAGVDARGVPFIAMEYVPGDSLIAWCDARGLDAQGRIPIFLQVLAAIGYAHERQVLHRDLKPSNILVTGQGQVRLLDFGVARLLDEEHVEKSVTRLYGHALTPEYASPELLRGEPIDARSDIYSLGVVLHELLTGQRPGHNSSSVLDDDLREIVQRALALNPAERYADAAAFATALRQALPSGTATSPTLQSLEAAKRPKTRFAPRGRWLIGGGIAATALVAALLVHELRAVPNPPATPTRPVAASSPIVAASVAVLPFVDLSEQHNQGYLGDGLAEELINTLARIPGLKVPARTSSFAYRDGRKDVREIAKELGVGALIEGSVRSADQQLRISAQLVDARDGALIWSQSYDRKITDLFTLQDELATTMEQALQLKLASGAPLQVTQAPPSHDVESYRMTLQGFSLLDRPTPSNYLAAKQLFEAAIQRDPGFARAHAGLAAVNIRTGPWKAGHDAAEAAARRALELDPTSAKAESILGQIEFERYDLVAAEEHHRRAAMLDPSDAVIRYQHAKLLAYVGQMREAAVQMREAYSLAPANPAVVGFASIVLAWLGDADAEAEKYAQLATELGFPPAYVAGGRVFPALRHGQFDRYAELMHVVNGTAADPDLDRSLEVSRRTFAARADPALRAAAEKVRLKYYPADMQFKTPRQSDLCAMSAMSYAYLGANDPAYELANQCLDNKIAPDMLGGEICPWPMELAAFRRDRRFQAYIARRGAIPYYAKYGPPDGCDFKDGKLSCR